MMSSDAIPNTLRDALTHHQIELADDQIELLDRYCSALWSWNEKLNLTRHLDYEKFVGRDVVDSLALEPFLDSGDSVLDVGTGGGVPGVVLAIARPDLKMALCDSVAKKAKAVQAIVEEIGMNVKVHHVPAQDIVELDHFNVLVARGRPFAKAAAMACSPLGFVRPAAGDQGPRLGRRASGGARGRAAEGSRAAQAGRVPTARHGQPERRAFDSPARRMS